MEERLSTKEFAQMCKVERRTLHYYDEIGLLVPIEVRDNGYRAYAPSQIDTMGMIKALQAVGMPLNEIKKLMKEENLSISMPLLHKQIQLIREKQEELRNAEHMLTHATNQLENYLTKGDNIFYTEYSKDIPLLIQNLEGERMPYINYVTYGYQYGVIMKEEEPNRLESVYRIAATRRESNAIKVAGNYACIYRRAKNGKVGEVILSFLEYLKKNSILTTGNIYMDNIATDFIKLPEEEYLFKLSIRCRGL
jgi:DNA-binding transcriptional MerR regulator